jgi:hypothetical protein
MRKQLRAVMHDNLDSKAKQLDFFMLTRYIFGALTRSTKHPNFRFVVTPAQHVDHVNSVLQLCHKGSKVLSRGLGKWGNFRAEQFAGQCRFLGLTEQFAGQCQLLGF